MRHRPQPYWAETGWTPAQRMAQSMLWGRRPAGRVTEAGIFGWAWSLAPKIATWLGGLGIYIAVTEVVTDLEQGGPNMAWAEAPATDSQITYWRDRVMQWWNYAFGSSPKGHVMDPNRAFLLQPVYARALQMIDEPGVTKGQVFALYAKWARYVLKQVEKYPYIPGPGEVPAEPGTITGEMTIYMDPATGGALTPGRAGLGIMGWLSILAGAYSYWRQLRG